MLKLNAFVRLLKPWSFKRGSGLITSGFPPRESLVRLGILSHPHSVLSPFEQPRRHRLGGEITLLAAPDAAPRRIGVRRRGRNCRRLATMGYAGVRVRYAALRGTKF